MWCDTRVQELCSSKEVLGGIHTGGIGFSGSDILVYMYINALLVASFVCLVVLLSFCLLPYRSSQTRKQVIKDEKNIPSNKKTGPSNEKNIPSNDLKHYSCSEI